MLRESRIALPEPRPTNADATLLRFGVVKFLTLFSHCSGCVPTQRYRLETMARRLAILLCSLAVFQILGGPLAALQTIAWVRMAVSYSRDGGVEAGIAKTFDGQHMCSLCKEIAKKREGEQKDLGDVLLNKIHLQCAVTAAQLFPPEFYWLRQLCNSFGQRFVPEPPLQPPKTV